MNKNILYLTYDGLSDSLGQSQILPYLSGLSDYGYSITIISCEKKHRLADKKKEINNLLKKKGIEWHATYFLNTPPLFSTISNFYRLRKLAYQLNTQKKFSIIHCRSYITALIGLKIKKKLKTKFIFDMRGFWADERIEGGLWNLKNPIYRTAYDFFKRKEIEFFSNADYTIGLTEKTKQIIHSWKSIKNQPIKIQVIPCCVNIEYFQRSTVSKTHLIALKKSLSIQEGDFVVSYLGSLGTWYCVDEMLEFFKILLLSIPTAKFLFLTTDDSKLVVDIATHKNISKEHLIITSVKYTDVPLYLALSNFSVFFIRKTFSKQASSPTKMGELLAMGIPIICNAGIGDTEEIMSTGKCGIMLTDCSDSEYQKAVHEISQSTFDNLNIRKVAEHYFSLADGVNKYHRVYTTLLEA